jgi:hypothetical protein
MFSLAQQIEEIEREIRLRREVYPRMVSNGRMKKSVADYHLARMVAVLGTLQTLQKETA